MIKQNVLDDHQYCTVMPFLELSGFIGCCMCSSSERQLPTIRFPMIRHKLSSNESKRIILEAI